MYQLGVTISIPNRNQEIFLPRCVQSATDAVRILRQRDIPAEVLVVDDASRDGSHALLRQLEARYCDSGLRVRTHETSLGAALSRNTALREARFHFVLFLDPDCQLIGENLHLFLQTIRDTGAAAVFGNVFRCKPGVQKSTSIASNESFQNRLFNDNYIDGLALFDRFQVMDVAGYDATYSDTAAWELWGRLAAHGRKIVFVPIAMGRRYEVPDSNQPSLGDRRDSHTRLKTTYDQAGFREQLRTNSHHLRYHPEIGYL